MGKPLALVAVAASAVLLAITGPSSRAAWVNYRFNPATGNVYAVTDTGLTWTAAEAEAVLAGTHLVTVGSDQETYWLGANYGSVWIGFNDAATEGTWVWSSGTGGTFQPSNWFGGTSYHKWNHPNDGGAGGEPNGGTGENYAHVMGSGLWNDLSGAATLPGAARFDVGAALGGYLYNPATQHVYVKTTTNHTWANAELVARALGGNLATINDAAENEWVRANTGGGWIGLNDAAVEGTFVWSSGQPVAYTNWNPGEPNGGTGENYAAMYGGGTWNDAGAASTNGGIVEFPTAVSQTAMRFNPANGHVYLATNSVPWEDAERFAMSQGGHLATINDAAENNFVRSFSPGWIGLTDKNQMNNWQWASGEAVTYQNWNPGEPNGASVENYAEVMGNGLWNDLSTQTRAGVVELPTTYTPGTYRYNPATQHVYLDTTNSVTWKQAQTFARSLGGDLVTVNDQAENAWVSQNMGGGWIGFNDEAAEGTWTWSSGAGGTWDYATWSGTSYHKWNHPNDGGTGVEPNNSGNEDYAEITTPNGFWNDLGAAHTRRALVEFPTAVAVAGAMYNPANHHVYLKTNGIPWEDAQRVAMAFGGNLATINDQAENDFVRSQVGQSWIGLTDRYNEGNFAWVDGQAVGYTNWNAGEPNGGTGENYGMIYTNGKWNDAGAAAAAPGAIELPVDFQVSEYRYNPFTQRVYARTNALPWEQARVFAQALGGDLASIGGAGENNWLQGQYSGDNWIGLYDVADQTGLPDPPGDWRWTSGEPVNYTRWGAGEPNGASEDHATLRGDQQWNDLSGANARRAIVEFPETVTLDAAHFNPATGKVYLKSNSLPWEAAQRAALAVGGNLATINSAAENEYVAAATRGGWIGYTDRFNEGTFTWANGETPGYSNWNPGEPNDAGGEDYAEMQGNGRWNDLGTPASHNRQGIIELPGTYTVGEYKWNPATGRVYARTNAVNWQTGYLVARAAGGDLAEINDAAENAWVNSSYGGDKWIGLIDATDFVPVPGTDPPGVWIWSTGNPATGAYTNWAPGEPNGVNEDVGNMRGDGLWNDLPDTAVLQAVVEFPDAVPGTTLSGHRYNPGTDKIYALTPNATWRAAQLIARVNNAHLTTVNDTAENQWLADTMTGGSTRWVGMTDEGHDGGWVWASGEGGAWIQGTGGSSFTNWNAGEPNGGTGENYAAMYANGTWNDAGDATQLQGIVEIQARTPTWRFNPGSGKLNAQTDNLIWEDAELQAQHWGGHLATVPNAAANEFIRATWGGGWIGLNDAASEGNFQWVSGQPVTYSNWAAGEPNNAGGNEDYTTMRSNGEWNDYGPANYQYGVAEKDATPPRWIFNPATGRWYASTDSLPWADAEAQARYWGVHLTTINDAAENAFVAGRFGGATPWIGLNDAATEGTFVWADGQPVAYTSWNAGEPNNAGNEDYAQTSGGGGWNDLPGDRYLTGVAEGDTAAVRASLQLLNGPTPGVRYAILGQMTWEDAEAAARELGGHLATVRDPAENAFLQSLAQELGGEIWLGYTDKLSEGDWRWASGLDTYFTNWNAGEPNDSGGEDYAAMIRASGLWNDVGASAMYFAVVEFVPEPSTFVLGGLGLAILACLAWRRRGRAGANNP